MTVNIENRFFHLAPGTPAARRLGESEQFFLAGNLNEALAAAQQAWREHPREADVYRVLAYLHMARGEYPPAAQAAYQAVSLDPHNPASLATLSQVYVTFNNLGLAEEALAMGLARFPTDTMLQTLSADVHFRRGRMKMGLQRAQEALKQQPDDPYTRALIGIYYLRRRDYATAAQMLGPAVTAYPQRWDYLRDYGVALLHTGLYAEARQLLTRAFRLRPDDPVTRHNLCQALHITEDRWPWRWILNLFFARVRWLGHILQIIGVIMLIVSLPWLIVAAADFAITPTDIFMPAGFMVLSMFLIIATQGVSILYGRGKRGEKYIRRMIGE